jgi:hypothetical protein
VQNAIIGDDNSVTGGAIGAFGLLAIHWLVARTLFRSPRLTRVLEGRAAVPVHNGQLERCALERESPTREELLAVIHRQGFEDFIQYTGANWSRTGPSTRRHSIPPPPTGAMPNRWPVSMRFPGKSRPCARSHLTAKLSN